MEQLMKAAMRDYFERLLDAWARQHGTLPHTAWNEDADPAIYVGEPDAEEWIAWRPVEKTVRHDLRELEVIRGHPVHPSLEAYFNSYWFAAIGGRIGPYRLTLEPVLPGIEIESFLAETADYAQAHDGRLDSIPLGIDASGLLLVVDADSGRVLVEDVERQEFEEIAESLPQLIRQLEV
jgi:hypothetical protein